MSTSTITDRTIPPAANLRTLGALPQNNGTSFRVWTRERSKVELVLYRSASQPGQVRELQHEAGDYWTGCFDDVRPGTLYKFRLDGNEHETFPDPASRYQPFGVHGPSQVIDPYAYRWRDHAWTPPPFDALVIYELHVGTFSREGTFETAVARLPHLVDLGVTAIELMPVAEFAGKRNWGYDGVALFAPSSTYGTPDDLRTFVDAAHAAGLAVFVDVVYNHFGPDGAYANAFSPHYFTDAHQSPWGRGVNLDRRHSEHVRRFFIENAAHWVAEYHADGLRLDATHALIDESPCHFLAELSSTLRAYARRPTYFIAEDHRNLAALVQPVSSGGLGMDAVWADDFHHQVRVHVAGDREGYYADFTGITSDLARTIEQGWFFTGQFAEHQQHARGTDPSALDPKQFVICIQNHDQIGNRADGARLNHQVDPATYRAVSTLLLLAPQTPLLFMGQEWAATSPFLFFTDHHDELGALVTAGRREEFSSFAAFADPARRAAIADPQALSSFDKSRLDWVECDREPHAGIRRLYQRLLSLRRTLPALQRRARGSYVARAPNGQKVLLDYHGSPIVIVKLSGAVGAVEFEAPADAEVILSTEDSAFAADASPIEVGGTGSRRIARFTRPGAVVLARRP